ncbi:nuclear localization sequence binding protein [Spiromyces aspiralis]|uniref:Nuclear localization sequence binding protein n=1 Tax=Spiromyces aspiralis TaxID=68401 RepID=A0ACC1HVV3_9FUNG|nr:nuclear localization sequence binding protein [Spiromyces aspiralis]
MAKSGKRSQGDTKAQKRAKPQNNEAEAMAKIAEEKRRADDSEDEVTADNSSSDESSSESSSAPNNSDSSSDGSDPESNSSDSEDGESGSDEEEDVKDKKESKDQESSSDSDSSDEEKDSGESDSSSGSESESESDSGSDSSSNDEDESDEESEEDDDKSSQKKRKASDSPSDSDSSSDEESEEDNNKSTKKLKASDGKAVTTATTGDDQGPQGSAFVGNLSWSITDESLKEAFSDCEGLIGARVVTDRNTGRSRGFGYLDFTTRAAAEEAVANAADREIEGRAVRLEVSEPKSPRFQGERSASGKDKFASKGGNSEPTTTLFIGNLSFDSTEESVRAAFEECGTVNSVRLVTDRDTGKPKGFGYIEFADITGAKESMKWNNTMLNGRNIRLDYAAPRGNSNGGNGFRGGRGGRGGRGDRGGRGGRGGPRGGGRGGTPRTSRVGNAGRGTVQEFKGQKTTFNEE